MGAPGQSSSQITFKVNKVLREKIERERELSGGTLAEFMNDAVKFYIDHLEQRRHDEMKYRQYLEKLQQYDGPETDMEHHELSDTPDENL